MITNITVNFTHLSSNNLFNDIVKPELIYLKGVGRTEERGQAGPQASSKAAAAQSEFF